MTYVPTLNLEFQRQQAVIYLRFALAFLLLLLLSEGTWLVRLCACLFIATSLRSFVLFLDVAFDDFADAIFGPLEFAEEELPEESYRPVARGAVGPAVLVNSRI